MTLPEFILAHLETLLDDWSAFARSIPASRGMDLDMLRDHAEAMLRTIAADMLLEQSPGLQKLKSEGGAPRPDTADTAAERHGSDRRQSGFELVQMVAEFRALRATVIRRWLLTTGPSALEAVQELIRFNEALDQALAESLARFVKEVDEARELFLGVIAHDMRSPIGASMHAARYLKGLSGIDGSASNAVDIVLRSDERLNSLTTDILEWVQLKFQHGAALARAPVDLAALCTAALAALRMNHPHAMVTLEIEGDLHGEWDGPRRERLLANLVENAINHGAPDEPVKVGLHGEPDAVVLTVSNSGEPIPPEQVERIFEPMTTLTRGPDNVASPMKRYGLGLFIVREIVRGHGGTIRAESSRDGGTCFRILLPRRPSGKTASPG